MNNFLIFKVDNKKNEKSPDYVIRTKIEEKFVEIGAGWIKESGKGTKYISCKLSNPYKDRKGFKIVESSEEIVKEQNIF